MTRNWISSRGHVGQNGVTLVEILVALTVGALLLSGVLQIFIGSKSAYRVQEGLSRLQENGRYAMEYLTRDLRMAGYMGCVSRLSLDRMQINLDTSSADYSTFLHDFAVPLQGYEATGTNTWTPALDSTIAGLSDPPMDGTDVLVVRRSVGDLPILPPYMPTVAAALHSAGSSSDPNDLQQGDIVVVSDCERSALFQISNSNPSTTGTVDHNTGAAVSPGNVTQDLPKTFEGDAQILRPVVKTFYIAPGASGQPALREFNNTTGTLRELVEGVENMQVLYGVDTGSDEAADVYVTANNLPAGTTWNDVVAVRISLLLRTIDDNLATEALAYTFNGATVTPTDRRVRRIFTVTVGLRNKIL